MSAKRMLAADPADRHARVLSAGRAWADLVCVRLRREGRRVAGGWPGTVSEARVRALAALHPQAPLLPEEHATLSLALYAAAKKTWLERQEPCEREEPEPEEADSL